MDNYHRSLPQAGYLLRLDKRRHPIHYSTLAFCPYGDVTTGEGMGCDFTQLKIPIVWKIISLCIRQHRDPTIAMQERYTSFSIKEKTKTGNSARPLEYSDSPVAPLRRNNSHVWFSIKMIKRISLKISNIFHYNNNKKKHKICVNTSIKCHLIRIRRRLGESSTSIGLG